MNESSGVCNASNEADMDEEAMLSDQESVSLLQDLPPFQNRSSAVSGSHEIKNKPELNQQKRGKPHSCKGEKSVSYSRSAKVPTEKKLHKRNEKGENLLHKACRRKDLPQVRMLLQAGISVNMEDYAGWTPLHEACASGDESVVEELLRAGANVNARSCEGVTPLHDAVYCGHHQVVKLLLQNGSIPAYQKVGGKTLLDMAEDRSMKELLMSFQTSCEGQRKSGKGATRCEEPDAHPRESGDAGGESTDVQLKRVNNFRAVKSSSEAVSALLEDASRKQAEMSTWPLKDLKDAGRYKEVLLQTQNVLMDVLTKQRLEKNDLTHKFRVVSHHLSHRVLKSQFLSLASNQRHLVQLLQKQMQLEATFTTAKSKISAQSLNRQVSVAAPSLPDLQSEEAVSWKNGPQTRAALQFFSKMKGKNALVQRGANDDGGGLRHLVQSGVLPKGSDLHLTLKGEQHVAQVLSGGVIMSKGKSYRAPEFWLESILGNNIPVSSMYALNKVTFRDKPLSYYVLNSEAKKNLSNIRLEDDKDDSTEPEPSPESVDPYQLLRRIRVIHLVTPEEMIPNAVMDLYWEKLMKQDQVEFDNWELEL
ncbi:putative ankyrin repeat domain-containing protein 31 isoform X1 [Poecilia latipinna]|uniref:putative ankyrin repeat domain-containing protein 31 isoform X1 n=1 Tax=Poecilia latipinna TaxID=48699 RepID=UPI00072E23D4|nr:PREDICTED: putative ankyrin repeat domain-containing protein 31 isoform X1 [Poecilia latipinna]XP_014886852.1 PREDICTED: putative ankyrin repeat domain-containing protein 31 isoform X1 [Poecilia latipinna]